MKSGSGFIKQTMICGLQHDLCQAMMTHAGYCQLRKPDPAGYSCLDDIRAISEE